MKDSHLLFFPLAWLSISRVTSPPARPTLVVSPTLFLSAKCGSLPPVIYPRLSPTVSMDCQFFIHPQGASLMNRTSCNNTILRFYPKHSLTPSYTTELDNQQTHATCNKNNVLLFFFLSSWDRIQSRSCLKTSSNTPYHCRHTLATFHTHIFLFGMCMIIL